LIAFPFHQAGLSRLLFTGASYEKTSTSAWTEDKAPLSPLDCLVSSLIAYPKTKGDTMKFCILGPFLLIDLAEQRHCFPNTESGYREMARAFIATRLKGDPAWAQSA